MSIAVAGLTRSSPVRSRVWVRAGGLVLAIGLLAAVAASSLAIGAKAIALRRCSTPSAPTTRRSTTTSSSASCGCPAPSSASSSGRPRPGRRRDAGRHPQPARRPGAPRRDAGASLAVVVGIFGFGIVTLAATSGSPSSAPRRPRDRLRPRGHGPRGGDPGEAGPRRHLRAARLVDLAISCSTPRPSISTASGRSARSPAATTHRGVAPFLAVGAVLALASAADAQHPGPGRRRRPLASASTSASCAPGALAVVLLCGAATAAAGPIGFVGLAVPHVARAITGPDYRWILPYSMVLGPSSCSPPTSSVGRRPPGELEVGVVTAFLGAPVFIALVRRRKLAEL